MDQDAFREALLQVMEQKTHWAWPAFSGGLVPHHKLHVHLEQEYAVYVRDFPVLIGRAYVQCPIAEVRQELVENMYEEETGGMTGGRPHPELFLEYPRGLGMDLSRFESIRLLPRAAAYRAFIDEATLKGGWQVGTAITTLFLEGTAYERGELDDSAPKRPILSLSQHPLVKHYGLPLEHLALTKAHRSIEGEHRAAAWRVILNHVAEPLRPRVVHRMQAALERWLAYRDEVAEYCGIERSDSGEPVAMAG